MATKGINRANICHLMLDVDLDTKQLHSCDKFNNITSSGNPTNRGWLKTTYRSQISGSCRRWD